MSAPINGPERSTTTDMTVTINAVSAILSARSTKNMSWGDMTLLRQGVGMSEGADNASFRSRYRLHKLKPIAEGVGDVATLVTIERLILIRLKAALLQARAQA